jgi:hypothetical protein
MRSEPRGCPCRAAHVGRWRVGLCSTAALAARHFTASGNAFAVNPGDPGQLLPRVGCTL